MKIEKSILTMHTTSDTLTMDDFQSCTNVICLLNFVITKTQKPPSSFLCCFTNSFLPCFFFLSVQSCVSVLLGNPLGCNLMWRLVTAVSAGHKSDIIKNSSCPDIALLTLASHIKINDQKHCTLIDQGLISQKAPQDHVHLGPLPQSTMKLKSYSVFTRFGGYQAGALQSPNSFFPQQ